MRVLPAAVTQRKTIRQADDENELAGLLRRPVCNPMPDPEKQLNRCARGNDVTVPIRAAWVKSENGESPASVLLVASPAEAGAQLGWQRY